MKTEEKSAVTKGPWYVGCQNDGHFIINRPPSPSGSDVVWAGHKDTVVVGKVYDQDDYETTSANAKLLAAAPTLLKAAELALEHLKRGRTELIQESLIHAIRKAKEGWNHGD